MFKKISQNLVNSPLKFCLISHILSTAYGMYVQIRHIFIQKILIFFLFKRKTHCGYSIEAPHLGASNKHHNMSFHGEIRNQSTDSTDGSIVSKCRLGKCPERGLIASRKVCSRGHSKNFYFFL